MDALPSSTVMFHYWCGMGEGERVIARQPTISGTENLPFSFVYGTIHSGFIPTSITFLVWGVFTIVIDMFGQYDSA